MASMIYLASPYSHPSEAVRYARYLAARFTTIALLKNGVPVFSPIVYGKDMESIIGTAYEPWATFNDSMIEICTSVHVLCLEGWNKSRGIEHEVRLATALNKPVFYFTQNGEKLNAYP